MSKDKFTPGPWVIRRDDKIGFVVKCATDTTGILGTVAICGRKSDAKLISAAPNLLEACKEAKRMYDELQPAGGWQGVDDLLIDAIAKVGG